MVACLSLLLAFTFITTVFSDARPETPFKTTSNESRSFQTPCPAFSFNEAPEYETGKTKGVAIADFDGDGLRDIAAAFSDATEGFSVLRNLGESRFGPKSEFFIPNGTLVVESVFAQDLDRDGGWILSFLRR
jgi:hypothetical protein